MKFFKPKTLILGLLWSVLSLCFVPTYVVDQTYMFDVDTLPTIRILGIVGKRLYDRKPIDRVLENNPDFLKASPKEQEEIIANTFTDYVYDCIQDDLFSILWKKVAWKLIRDAVLGSIPALITWKFAPNHVKNHTYFKTGIISCLSS